MPLETINTVTGTTVSDANHIFRNPSTESSFDVTKHTEEANKLLSKHLIYQSSDTLHNRMDQCSSLCMEEVANQTSANLHLASSEREVSLELADGGSNMDFPDKDLCLSTELKCSHSPRNLQVISIR